MYRLFKTIHLIGLAMVLGSLLGEGVISACSGPPDGPTFAAGHGLIAAMGAYLTLPGLAVAVASGVGLMVAGRLSPKTHLWLAIHLALAVALVLLTALVLAPIGADLADQAMAMPADVESLILPHMAWLARAETVAAAVALLLCMLLIVIGVWRPRRFTRFRRRPERAT